MPLIVITSHPSIPSHTRDSDSRFDSWAYTAHQASYKQFYFLPLTVVHDSAHLQLCAETDAKVRIHWRISGEGLELMKYRKRNSDGVRMEQNHVPVVRRDDLLICRQHILCAYQHGIDYSYGFVENRVYGGEMLSQPNLAPSHKQYG